MKSNSKRKVLGRPQSESKKKGGKADLENIFTPTGALKNSGRKSTGKEGEHQIRAIETSSSDQGP